MGDEVAVAVLGAEGALLERPLPDHEAVAVGRGDILAGRRDGGEVDVGREGIGGVRRAETTAREAKVARRVVKTRMMKE